MEIGKAEVFQNVRPSGDPVSNGYRIKELEERIESLERTLAGLQILLGKASEYKARPKRERLP